MPPPRNIFTRPVFWVPASAAIVVAVLLAVWPREPRYQGKSLSYWLDRLPAMLVGTNLSVVRVSISDRVSGDSAEWSGDGGLDRFEAAMDRFSFPGERFSTAISEAKMAKQAVNAIGPQCLGTVLRRLRSKDTQFTRLKTYLVTFAVKWHPIRKWFRTSATPDIRRGQAVTALFLLSDAAKPALPELIAIAKTDSDPGVRASALEVLRHLSPEDFERIKSEQEAAGKIAGQ